MNEKWKKYDIDLSFDEDPDLSFDTSLTELSSLFDSAEMVPDLRGSVMQSVAESLPDTHPSVFEQDSLSSTFLPATSAISAASSVGFSAIAESMKPLSAACSAASMKSMAISAGDFCSSFAAITAASESICPNVVETAVSMADKLSNAISVAPAVTAAMDSALCVQSAMQASASLLPEAIALERVPSLSEYYGEVFEATNALHEGVASVADMNENLLEASAASVCLVKTAGEMADERNRIIFDMSHIARVISEFIDSNSFINKILDMSLSSFVEMIKDFGRRSLSRLHEIAHFLLHVLWSTWEKRPRLIELICYDRISRDSSFVNIGLSPPEQVREYVVQIRERFLLRTQNRGCSEPDDDMPIQFFVSC